MSDKQKTAFLVAAAMAILHNGKRYEQNDVIELTEEEADKLEIYIKPNTEHRAQAEQTASDELTAAEQVESDAEEAAAETAAEEEELGEEAGETTKSNKGKNK